MQISGIGENAKAFTPPACFMFATWWWRAAETLKVIRPLQRTRGMQPARRRFPTGCILSHKSCERTASLRWNKQAISTCAYRQRLLTVREIENAIVLLKRGAQKATEFMCPLQRSKIEFALLFNLLEGEEEKMGVFNLNPWHNRQWEGDRKENNSRAPKWVKFVLLLALRLLLQRRQENCSWLFVGIGLWEILGLDSSMSWCPIWEIKMLQ